MATGIGRYQQGLEKQFIFRGLNPGDALNASVIRAKRLI